MGLGVQLVRTRIASLVPGLTLKKMRSVLRDWDAWEGCVGCRIQGYESPPCPPA